MPLPFGAAPAPPPPPRRHHRRRGGGGGAGGGASDPYVCPPASATQAERELAIDHLLNTYRRVHHRGGAEAEGGGGGGGGGAPPPRPHFLLPGDSTGPSTGKGTETGKGTAGTETETETETGTGSCGGILPLPVLLADREAAGGTGRRVRPPHWRRPQPLGLPVPGLAPSTSSELSLPPPPPPAREGEGTEGAGVGKEAGAGKASASASARFPALSCPAAAAIGTDLRRYAEHASATRFHWSYLGSTGIPPEGQVPRGGSAAAAEASAGGRRGGGTEAGAAPRVTDPLTAHAAPSTPAVSTISLAFSPDGATLASTHGDHTVKITCALTGRLIRSLEGHPRTPWTVKYHPTQPNIVASGCLGFQVRVWDWNYRPAAAAAAAALGRGGEGPPMGGAGGLQQQQQQQQGRRSGSPRTVGQPDPAAGTREVRPHPHLPPARPDHDVLPPRLAGGAPEPHRHDYHLSRGVCLSMIRLQFAIISLSFHPTGHVLACASGSKVHLWDWDDRAGRERREWEEEIRVGGREGETGTGGAPPPSKASAAAAAASSLALPPSSGAAPQERQIGGSGGQIGEYSFPHALRCVHFPPSGRHLIIGGANPGHGQQGGGMSGGGMTFCLRLWDFDLGAALHPRGAARPGAGGGGRGGGAEAGAGAEAEALGPGGDGAGPAGPLRTLASYQADPGGGGRRSVLENPRILTDRALLYNDGGFDVSADGTRMCACVEYFLEDGVDDISDFVAAEAEELAADLFSSEEGEARGGGDCRGARAGGDEGASAKVGEGEQDGATRSHIFSSPPRAEAMGGGSRAPSEPPAFALSNPMTPPPAASLPATTPPSPPGRRYSSATGGGGHPPPPQQQQQLQRASKPPSRSDVPPQRSVVPMPSLSRRHGHSIRRSRGGNGEEYVPHPGGPHRGVRGAVLPPHPPTHHRHGGGRGGESSGSGDAAAPAAVGGVNGRWVPHVVTLSLETIAPAYVPQTTSLPRYQYDCKVPLGSVVRACRLGGPKASGVTCVKFSPSAEYCLLGYGVRETTTAGGDANGNARYHPVAALYGFDRGNSGGGDDVRGWQRNGALSGFQLVKVTTMLSADDDVNIARFHPESGYGFVYGTKQGRVRVLSPRPWNYYYG